MKRSLRLAPLLAILTLVTALLPFVLHQRLLLLTSTSSSKDTRNSSISTSYDWKNLLANNTAQTPSWTLFYHMYFPPNDAAGYQHAASIVQEQLQMVGTSFAAQRQQQQQQQSTSLYYTVIGDEIRNATWMQDLCRTNNLQCTQIQHLAEGQEDVTLQALYDYCQYEQRQDGTSNNNLSQVAVIYLHTKGSFHAAGPKFATQDIWRQLLTQAATHQNCLQAVTVGQCETCSLLLQPLPGIHYPGNMWTATCQHIVRLLPPNTFAKRMDKVVHAFTRIRDDRHARLNTTFFAQMPHMMGRMRFAAEHWLGSHPALQRPCDLSAHVTANLSRWLHPKESNKLSAANFTLGFTPTFPIDDAHWDYFRYGKRGHVVLSTPALRLRDYFLLPGQLFKFAHLYGAVPPADSWMWTWFPDANVWQEKIRLYGSKFWEVDSDDWLPVAVELVVT